MRILPNPRRLLAAGLVTALVAGCLAAAAAGGVAYLAYLWVTPSSWYVFLPDAAHPVAPLVTVKGERPPKDGGGIYFVDVLVRRLSEFEQQWKGTPSGGTVVPASQVNPPGVGDAARRKEDLREMASSQQIAAAVAERALGYKVVAQPTGALISQVASNGPAAGRLEPTDVVTSVDGQPVRTPQDLRRLIGKHHPGETVRLTASTPSGLRRFELKTIADPNDHSHPLIGVIVSQAADIRLPLPVRIDAGGVGGPSAGLAFALDLMEELGRDVDHGYKVAATGEIGLDGSVGPIGGVKQKTIGARRSNVDVFLVPAGDNTREARLYADGLRIIPVQSFRQALQALATLPPKSQKSLQTG
jgi:Lon-like protease